MGLSLVCFVSSFLSTSRAFLVIIVGFLAVIPVNSARFGWAWLSGTHVRTAIGVGTRPTSTRAAGITARSSISITEYDGFALCRDQRKQPQHRSAGHYPRQPVSTATISQHQPDSVPRATPRWVGSFEQRVALVFCSTCVDSTDATFRSDSSAAACCSYSSSRAYNASACNASTAPSAGFTSAPSFTSSRTAARRNAAVCACVAAPSPDVRISCCSATSLFFTCSYILIRWLNTAAGSTSCSFPASFTRDGGSVSGGAVHAGSGAHKRCTADGTARGV